VSPLKPLAATPPAPQPTLLQTVASVIWARRWKIATTLGVYALARACEFAPPWALGACHLAARLAELIP
jgi:hypothetical protein